MFPAPGPNRDLALQNEPQQPMVNSDNWMVAHIKTGPNQNHIARDFFIGFFYSEIDHFLGVKNDSKKQSILL